MRQLTFKIRNNKKDTRALRLALFPCETAALFFDSRMANPAFNPFRLLSFLSAAGSVVSWLNNP